MMVGRTREMRKQDRRMLTGAQEIGALVRIGLSSPSSSFSLLSEMVDIPPSQVISAITLL